jgi:hypothetical protein
MCNLARRRPSEPLRRIGDDEAAALPRATVAREASLEQFAISHRRVLRVEQHPHRAKDLTRRHVQARFAIA